MPESEVFILSDAQIVSFGAGRSHVGFSSPIDAPQAHFDIFLPFKCISTFPALEPELTTPLRHTWFFTVEKDT